MEGHRIKKKILVVEDEQTIRELLIAKFSHAGFEVKTAHNGEDGLAAALEHQPDVILLDIVMPKMDGLSMLEELRKDKWGRRAHVMVFSNVNNDEVIADAVEKGVSDYMIKSDWHLKDIVERIKERLGMIESI